MHNIQIQMRIIRIFVKEIIGTQAVRAEKYLSKYFTMVEKTFNLSDLDRTGIKDNFTMVEENFRFKSSEMHRNEGFCV